jgi:hypothetical protein
MDIVVHGTKGGYEIFTPKKLGGLLDVNSDGSKTSAIGQEAYAIRFVEKTIIFSKYKIIRDVRGGKRTGFLAFSLFLPNNKKLPGIEIINLLNEVSREYCSRYIPENDNNLEDVREVWTFLDRISQKYQAMLRTVSSEDIENLLSGTKEDAFIYYRDEELQKYFSIPHHEKYTKFRQVLFVKVELKDKLENPLNALRHSEDNLTGIIDLEIPYKLLFNQTAKGGVRIDVKVNGIPRTSRSKINRNDGLEISWSKPYCKTVSKKGKWNEISNEFIDVNETSESVSIKEIIPPEETKIITFTIKNWEGTIVNDAKIICKFNDFVKPIENNQVSFKGDDLGKLWTVSANNKRLSGEEIINFAKKFPGDAGSVEIILNKHELKLTVQDGIKNDITKNCTINQTKFIEKEIGQSHTIVVKSRDYDSHSFNYDPLETEINEPIILQRKQVIAKPINLHSPEKKEKGKGDSQIILRIILGLIVVALVVVLFIIVRLWIIEQRTIDEPPRPKSYTYIQTYIEGNSLILDTLNSYKKALKEEQINIPKSLDSAIKKREAIDSLNFSEIKSFKYDKNQHKFISTIKNIPSSKYDTVKSKLGDVSSLSLEQIADSINNILNDIKSSKDDSTDKVTRPNDKKKIKNIESEAQSDTPKQQVTETSSNQKTSSNSGNENNNSAVNSNKNVEFKILQKLKSSSVTREELNDLKNSKGKTRYANSIGLYLNFLNLVSNGEKDKFCNLLNQVNSNDDLKSSELQKFLNTICKDDNYFNKFQGLAGKVKIKTLAELSIK